MNSPVFRQNQFLGILSGTFSALLVISTVITGKIFMVYGFTVPAGAIVFPLTFIINDVMTEVYGFAESRTVIWTGLLAQGLCAVVFKIAVILPAAPFWTSQQQFATTLSFVPRVAIAGILAYFFGELTNSIVLSQLKFKQKGRRGLLQALRFILSTIIGEAIDTTIFMTLCFGGVLTRPELVKTALSVYLFKVGYETIMSPISVMAANLLKKAEGIDTIDDPSETSYNPIPLLRRLKWRSSKI